MPHLICQVNSSLFRRRNSIQMVEMLVEQGKTPTKNLLAGVKLAFSVFSDIFFVNEHFANLFRDVFALQRHS